MKTIKQLITLAIFGVIIVVGVSALGLYNPTRAKLIGKWDVSFEMTQTDLREMGIANNPLSTAAAQTLVNVIQANMQVEFREDDTAHLAASTLGFMTGESGKWRVASTAGENVTIAVQFAGEEAEKQWTIRFLDENTFQMESPEDSRFPLGQIVVFKRVAEAAS